METAFFVSLLLNWCGMIYIFSLLIKIKNLKYTIHKKESFINRYQESVVNLIKKIRKERGGRHGVDKLFRPDNDKSSS